MPAVLPLSGRSHPTIFYSFSLPFLGSQSILGNLVFVHKTRVVSLVDIVFVTVVKSDVIRHLRHGVVHNGSWLGRWLILHVGTW